MANFVMMKSLGGSEIAVNPDLVHQIVPGDKGFSSLMFEGIAKTHVKGTVAEVAERLSAGAFKRL